LTARSAIVSTSANATSILSSRLLFRLTWALVAVGLVWRTMRYLLQMPIWGDEEMLAMGFARHGYFELIFRLGYFQIAPLFFLWGERAILGLLGPSELAIRLLPFAAGVAALLLHRRFAALLLEPTACLFAVGFLAVAIWPVSMCTFVKPYSLDLFMALALLVPASLWLLRRDQPGWLALLTVLGPAAALSSYPVAFVAGGISLAFLGPMLRERWTMRAWYAAFNLAFLAGFAAACYVGQRQMETMSGAVPTGEGMTAYWEDAFPPRDPATAAVWLVLRTTGQMAAYPIGGSNGASALTVILCGIGLAELMRRKQAAWAILLVAPIGLNLLAAILRKYPYGGSCRLSQHLAPGICVLAGLGVAVLLERVRRPELRRCGIVAVTALFVLVGLGGMARDFLNPQREPFYRWARDVVAEIRWTIPGREPLVICTGPDSGGFFDWYWTTELRHPVTWNSEPPSDAPSRTRVWAFHALQGSEADFQPLLEKLRKQDPAWRLTRLSPYCHEPELRDEMPYPCQLACFERGSGGD
jgi:hypothetical protein